VGTIGVEETYGTMKLARRLIGEVLEEKVRKVIALRRCTAIGLKILRENALRFLSWVVPESEPI
jgi:hypothetical protein